MDEYPFIIRDLATQDDSITQGGKATPLVLLPDSASMDAIASVQPSVQEQLHDYFPSLDYLSSYLYVAEKPPFVEFIPHYEGAIRDENIKGQVWFTPLMLLMSVVYVWFLSTCSKSLMQDVKLFFYPKNRVISVAIFCYIALTEFQSVNSHSYLFTISVFSGYVVAYIVFKLLAIWLMCFVFFDRNLFFLLLQSYFTLFVLLSIGLFCIDVLYIYSTGVICTVALYFGVGICAMAVLAYLYKVMAVFLDGIPSLFYLILYLCTLEILPSLVLVYGLMNIV